MAAATRQWADEAEPLLVDEWRRDRFKLLRDKDGSALSREELDSLMEAHADWHMFDKLVRDGCPIGLALEVML